MRDRSSARYRADIDGLRAVAVLGVVLFHLDVAPLGGGFVGVDVFFVISGFLITRLIRDEVLATGSFNFPNFYMRRARRLFPALFFTLCVSFLLAAAFFSPQHLEEFGGSLVHAALMVSNVFFWSEAGYFDTEAAFKPLLHTWSLSVEEQFYLVWPLVLVFLLRKAPRRSAPVVLVLGAGLSLALNHAFADGSVGALARLSPAVAAWFADGQSSIFYLAPFRAYELALGALMAWLVRFQPKNRLVLEPLVPAGLALIVYPFFAFTRETPIPSWNALVPCLGAALIIYGGTARHSGRLLDNRLAVGIGLRSYSLYLVHWPAIVFYKYRVAETLSIADRLVLGLGSLAAAAAMYRLVERPFRHRRPSAGDWPPSRFGFACALLVLLVLLPAASTWANGGWAWRFPKHLIEQLNFTRDQFDEYVWRKFTAREGAFSRNGKPRVLVIGNSQAGDFVNVLAEAGVAEDIDLATVRMTCKTVFPLPDEAYGKHFGDRGGMCREQHAAAMKSELLGQADTVVLVTSWTDWSLEYLEGTVRYLKGRGVRRVGVVGGKMQTVDGVKFIAQYALRGSSHRKRTPLNTENGAINERIRRAASEFVFVDLLELFCDDAGCQRVTEDGHLIVYDRNHFSPHGAAFVGKKARGTTWLPALTGAPGL